jgi:hypothetical protein
VKKIANIIVLCSVFAVIALTGCGKNETVPETDLGHLDIILDTATFRQVAGDFFLKSGFGLCILDTAMYKGQPSIDYFVVGQENFFHFSDQRGFWAQQPGSVNLIFQTRKPDMKDSIYIVWKRNASYGLEENISESPGNMLIEVFPLVNWNDISFSRVLPFITTHSAETYRTMGYNDNDIRNGVNMKSFITKNVGSVEGLVFKSFLEIELYATTQEKQTLNAAFLAAGYETDGDKYVRSGNPTIKINVKEEPVFYKISKAKVKLSKSIPSVEKKYNRMKVFFLNDEAAITFE